jgi:anti-sigma B factor antagonist
MLVAEKNTGISVGRGNGDVHVRVAGRGTFQNGQPLRRYAVEMIGQGARQFVVDLGQCEGMDSTFLGVLAGIGLQLREPPTCGRLCLANVSPRNLELLQTLGLDRLFEIAPAAPVGIPLQQLADRAVSVSPTPAAKSEVADLMLEAHDNLIRADGRNQAKFKDVTAVLRARATEKPS